MSEEQFLAEGHCSCWEGAEQCGKPDPMNPNLGIYLCCRHDPDLAGATGADNEGDTKS